MNLALANTKETDENAKNNASPFRPACNVSKAQAQERTSFSESVPSRLRVSSLVMKSLLQVLLHDTRGAAVERCGCLVAKATTLQRKSKQKGISNPAT